MKNYFDTVQNRLDKYKNKYTQHPRKAAIKMALFNLGCSLKKHKKIYTLFLYHSVCALHSSKGL